jgi:uncharacterized membrane protein
VDPTFGQFITKAFWDTEVYDRWVDVASTWTNWTPTWTSATSGTPSVGNGTLLAAYKRPDTSKTVYFRLRLIAGSTTGYGTGAWSFTLPSGLNATSFQSCSGFLFDTSSTSRYAVAGYLTGNAINRVAYTATVGISNGAPFTWATGDFLLLNGSYETS